MSQEENNIPRDEKTKRDAPDHKHLERQLSEYVAKKYASKARQAAPEFCPLPGMDGEDEDGVWSRINFDMRPEELVGYLDQYIVRQDEAKAVLATKICTHFNRAKYLSKHASDDPADGVGLIKNNVLLIGPTGVGKTYMVKLIAAKLGVPFVKGDATKFSETGYVGGDVEDLIRDLVHEAGEDLELAQYGIVYVDEIDKIAASSNLIGPDVSRTGVQRALLKPMEETEVDLKVAHDPISQIQAIESYRKTGKREKRSVNTRHILFVMSGAFSDLPEVIKRRLNKKELGFGAKVADPQADAALFHETTPQDLVEYGFENEFVGRLPVSVLLEELSAEDLHQILRNPNNPVIISKKRDFAAYGIDLRLEDEALKALAVQAAGMKTGARALVTVVEKALLPFERVLPSSDIRHLLVTPELVADPKAELERVTNGEEAEADLERFELAGRSERMELLKMIAKREALYADSLAAELTPARMDLIADEYYRAGMSLGAAFDRVIERLRQVREFEVAFFDRYGIKIKFNEAAEVAILAGAAAEGCGVQIYCQRLSQVLEPGLRLVKDRTGRTDFLLPEDAVFDTDRYLHMLFEEHYNQTLGEPRQS
ncbi:MAG: AAA family ATPase [Desulfarculaceae bacterium]|nr:AAA family ATPase [Desulfarculaceae bacterium]MCF8074089.1 AAA family ATPase [Desulfarculaceae bacterium]MCF8103788.1 AAA family ATPase [Desulfarculaceae bacterium]MCF8116823.1 AAA family ATPase [Desulfarculaceae bacterium]